MYEGIGPVKALVTPVAVVLDVHKIIFYIFKFLYLKISTPSNVREHGPSQSTCHSCTRPTGKLSLYI